jgi:general secretion pathway protein K
MMWIPSMRNWQIPRYVRRPGDGFILVAVLWILIMLAGLAVTYSAYLANTALSVEVNDDAVQVEALASAGVELAAYRLTAFSKKERPPQGRFDLRLGSANVTVTYVSEIGRIDLNAADKQLLSGLFTSLGAASQDADRFAERILDWRTPPKSNSPQASNSAQAPNSPQAPNSAQAANSGQAPNSPQNNQDGPAGNASFSDVDELWLVQGLPPALVERVLPFVTVYTGKTNVNILVAAPQVLAALPDMTPERLDGILNRRDQLAATAESAADVVGSEQLDATTESGDAYRIHVHIALHNGRRAILEAVIRLGDDRDDMPYHVYLWNAGSQTAGPVQ